MVSEEISFIFHWIGNNARLIANLRGILFSEILHRQLVSTQGTKFQIILATVGKIEFIV